MDQAALLPQSLVAAEKQTKILQRSKVGSIIRFSGILGVSRERTHAMVFLRFAFGIRFHGKQAAGASTG
jgi:hypothetical protein